jgi:hypothetical protein
MYWTLGALLRGRFGVVPPFLAAGKRTGQVGKLLAETAARLQQVTREAQPG